MTSTTQPSITLDDALIAARVTPTHLLIGLLNGDMGPLEQPGPEAITTVLRERLIEIEMPWSEVCMHLGIAGKPMLVERLPDGMAQVYDLDKRKCSFPITQGEAGLPRG